MKISLFYDHVTVLDYAYLDDHLGAMGNSLIVNVEFIGQTDEEGVVYDFSYAKKKVKEIIDRDCDHRLVIPKGLAKREAGQFKFSYHYGHDEKKLYYQGPEEAICEIPYAHVSYENLLAYLEEQVLKEMPKTVSAIKLSFVEEKLSDTDRFFHYTHGLKDHYGNCQRLIHGHRSTLKVFLNQERSAEMEQYLCRELFNNNIHFCFWENVVNKEEIVKASGSKHPEGRFEKLPNIKIRYTGNQGEFYGEFCPEAIYLIQTESTVENLSSHFAKLVKEKVSKNTPVTVYAYEGVAKGAKTSL